MKIIAILFSLFTALSLYSQVAINNDHSLPDNSAILDVKSNDKGLLIPCMTIDERNAIPSPADGLIVYCSNCGTNGSLSLFSHGSWRTYAPCGNPAVPVIGYHVFSTGQVTWNWSPGGDNFTGFRWSSAPVYSTALDIGSASYYVETGIECDVLLTRHLWAYNDCGVSEMTTMPLDLTIPAAPVPSYHVSCVTSIKWNWNLQGGTEYLGGESIAGGKMKESCTTQWN